MSQAFNENLRKAQELLGQLHSLATKAEGDSKDDSCRNMWRQARSYADLYLKAVEREIEGHKAANKYD